MQLAGLCELTNSEFNGTMTPGYIQDAGGCRKSAAAGILISRSGGIGRHRGLKIPRLLWLYEFKSRLRQYSIKLKGMHPEKNHISR